MSAKTIAIFVLGFFFFVLVFLVGYGARIPIINSNKIKKK